jgi:hypothetical protein
LSCRQIEGKLALLLTGRLSGSYRASVIDPGSYVREKGKKKQRKILDE